MHSIKHPLPRSFAFLIAYAILSLKLVPDCVAITDLVSFVFDIREVSFAILATTVDP